MAVTLTSTGITFSDGTAQSTAAAAGTPAGFQLFTSSGTWSHSGSGSPTSVQVMVQGGGSYSGEGANYYSGVVGASGDMAVTTTATTGNVAVVVGGTGPSGWLSAGFYQQKKQAIGSSFGPVTAGGGTLHHRYGNESSTYTLTSGGCSNAMSCSTTTATNLYGKGGPSPGNQFAPRAGQSGAVLVSW